MRARRGVALVLVFSMVLCIAFFTGVWFYLVRGEAAGTDQLARRLVATAAGEAVAQQLSALVHRKPWNERFYKLAGSPLAGSLGRFRWTFDQRSFPLLDQPADRLGALGRGSWVREERPSFRGMVKDLGRPKTYRLLLTVAFADVDVLMTWDKVWTEGLMGRLSGAADVVTTRVESADEDALDARLEAVKARARANAGPDGQISAQLDELVDALQSGRKPDILLTP